MQTVSKRSPQFQVRLKFPRPADAAVLLGLVSCLGAVSLQAATQVTSFDPPAATVGNARLLLLAVTQYTQDYDEHLPPASSAAAFDTALRPYVPDPSVFVSRVTGKVFVPNPVLSGKSLASFGDPSTIAIFQDVLPPSRTPDTVGFLDGHVERGGVIQGDPALLSVNNAASLALGITEYTQDNDAVFPPMKTQAAFKTALLPYVRNSSLFIDPNNGKPFLPNPALSQVSLESIADPYTTVLLQSQMPYRNGIPTIAYADGHVTPAPPVASGESDAANLKRIGLATAEYTQDYDGTLPLTADYSAFESELLPYTRSSQIFVSPGTQLPYVLNPAISGASLASIDDPSATELARDAQLNADGTLNRLEVDGRVHPDFYFLPKGLAIGPDDLSHLLWPSAGPQAALWTLQPGGLLKSTVSSSHAVSFSVGGDNKTRVLGSSSVSVGVFTSPITGGSTLETLDASNAVQDTQMFGPYDGWTALFVASGPDSSSRLLWQRYDGRIALWTLSPQGEYEGSVTVPKLAGGIPIGLALGGDGQARLLWKTAHDSAVVWTLSPSGTLVRAASVRSPAGEAPTALGLGTDGLSRVLSSDGAGKAALVTVLASGRLAPIVRFTLPGGGTASQIAIGSTGDLRVLWEASSGSGAVQTLTPLGAQTGVRTLTPYL